MLLITLVTLLLATTLQNGEFSSSTTSEPNPCMKLIEEGGQIACNITGEGGYERMSIGNCWVSCTKGSNKFLIPHRECERILGLDSWAGYQELVGKLPDYGFEYCDEDYQETLERWVKEWKKYKKNAIKTLCSNRRGNLA
uniref:Putative secreted protein n=1 Tax=Ixodes ricinus TaxID=34613 RepID=V5GQ19_IXORI